jgi:hypothetical protein
MTFQEPEEPNGLMEREVSENIRKITSGLRVFCLLFCQEPRESDDVRIDVLLSNWVVAVCSRHYDIQSRMRTSRTSRTSSRRLRPLKAELRVGEVTAKLQLLREILDRVSWIRLLEFQWLK